MKAAAILALVAVTSCGRASPDPSQDIADLKQRVAKLEASHDASPNTPPAAPQPVEPTYTYELSITWPGNPPTQRAERYATQEACEAAREAVFAENQRKIEADHAGDPPGTIYGRSSTASAVCLPLG